MTATNDRNVIGALAASKKRSLHFWRPFFLEATERRKKPRWQSWLQGRYKARRAGFNSIKA